MGIQCTLRENELRSWGRAIQSLCLMGGNEVQLQFTDVALTLTTCDDAISTFASLSFNNTFFSSYECEATDADNLHCKIPTKCLLKPFRSLKFLTKCASECSIEFSSNSDNLNITIITKFGAKISYSLHLTSNTELLQLDFDSNSLKSNVTCDAKLILGSLSNFHEAKGDLTLKIDETKMSLRNSITDLVQKQGKVYTELSLNAVDFIEYTLQQDCQVTFPFREFKTFVVFADTMRLPVTLRFMSQSTPVVVSIIGKEGTYEGSLTLGNRSHPDLVENDSRNGNLVTSIDAGSSVTQTRISTSIPIPHISQGSERLNNGSVTVSTTNGSVPRVRKKRPLLFPNLGRVIPSKVIPLIILSDSEIDE